MALKFTKSRLKEIVEIKTNNEYALLNVESTGKIDPTTGKALKREMRLKHNECGHIYDIVIYEFIEGGRCAKCKGKVLRAHYAEDIEVIKSKTKVLTKGEYSFVDEQYINSKTKHHFKHNTCGTVFKKKWEKFKGTPKQAGQRCPKCQRKGMESMASCYTRDIFDHFKIVYETEKRFNQCTNPKTGMILPFDYYLPDINTLIEIDGEQHERGSFNRYDREGTMKRDKIKNKFAKDNGITLIRIPAKKWSQLPEILHTILSEKLLPSLELETVKAIPSSTRPERINKDLKKVHNGAYLLHDLYFFGVDRKHKFKHLHCSTVFTHTLSRLNDEKYPCPLCRKTYIEKDKHDRSNKILVEKSKGRYTLDDSQIGTDSKGRRLVKCHQCQYSWRVTVGNLMGNKAGCPNCLHLKKEKVWQEMYALIGSAIQHTKKLTKAQKHWIWQNKKYYEQGKLQKGRSTLLIKIGLI